MTAIRRLWRQTMADIQPERRSDPPPQLERHPQPCFVCGGHKLKCTGRLTFCAHCGKLR